MREAGCRGRCPARPSHWMQVPRSGGKAGKIYAIMNVLAVALTKQTL